MRGNPYSVRAASLSPSAHSVRMVWTRPIGDAALMRKSRLDNPRTRTLRSLVKSLAVIPHIAMRTRQSMIAKQRSLRRQ
ncbi:hypothetical protein XHV734_4414 [Xanthomonas hortorum pv. vitians]|nr:hypothetical protein XHV734_4414 [Xanthomonas hortorum pv. vitians]